VTTTETRALQAMLEHHRILDDELKTRVSALAGAFRTGDPHEPASADLVAYLAGEVLPHAAAEEERTIYPAAAARADLAGTVGEMTSEHQALSAAAERLASTASGSAAVEQAYQIASLFSDHVAKENDILLPALHADEGTDLAALLAEMHRRTAEARRAPQAQEAPAGDPQAAVLSLLMEAATALARAGQADRACRLAASAWAALRGTRPDLAVRVTAALHGLGRRTSGRTPAHPADGGEPQDDQSQLILLGADRDLDVRNLAPAQRHETIFASYKGLVPGGGFVLVNDHDPKPMRYQFEAEHAGQFTWDSLEVGPEAWRVRIGRPPADALGQDGEAGEAGAGQRPRRGGAECEP
jgi:uncharacterized protein (DUF2249 family)/iron-sulfur cluster repair protein YtfE (RIC family)